MPSRRSLVLAVLACVAFGCTATQPAQPRALSEALDRFERALAIAHEQYGSPGIAVVVVDTSGVVREIYLGNADNSAGRTITGDDSFQIGSVTKFFTAHTLQLLAQEHKLKWGDPAESLLPELAGEGGANPVTLEDLASMRSGYTRANDLWWEDRLTRVELVAALAKTQDPSPTRDAFDYCNVAYTAIGLAAERATGKAWEDLVRSRIFEPAGAPVVFDPDDADPPRALPHRSTEQGTLAPIEHRALRAVAPAGGIVTTPRGLAAVAHRILTEPTHRAALEAQAAPRTVVPDPANFMLSPWFHDADALAYALGLFVEQRAGMRGYNHSGGIDGFSSDLWFLPDHDTAVIVLSNAGWNTSFFTRAAARECVEAITGLDARDWFEHYAQ